MDKKFNRLLVVALVSGWFGLQAWTLIEIVGLKVDVSAIKTRLELRASIAKDR